MKHVAKLIDEVIDNGAKSATKFVSPRQVIRVAQRLYKHRRRQAYARHDQAELVVTVGRPNYLERDRIKLLQRAGEPFPSKRLYFRWPPHPARSKAKKRR